MADDTAIQVKNVSKSFKLPHEKHGSLKNAFINFGRSKGFEKQRVLEGISFEVKKGEFFGIVGRNGSGKSTLLKLLAGIYAPDKGKIAVNGKLTPFIELGVGFNPELSGRDNVFLNGALLGFNRKEMEAMYDDIVAFAELERFMDQKLKNYSSGMQVRLAFSIAIRANTDILVLDEVLAVGDAAFQRKCSEYFNELKEDKRTVILVTHDMSAVEKYCTRALLIHDGAIVDCGEPESIASKYKLINLSPSNYKSVQDDAVEQQARASITSTSINGENEAILHKNQDNLEISIGVEITEPTIVAAGVSIIRDDGTYIAYFKTNEDIKSKRLARGEYNFSCTLSAGQLLSGAYVIDVALYDENNIYLDRKVGANKFAISRTQIAKGGLFSVQGEWRLKEK